MDTPKVQSLIAKIQALSEAERQALAGEVLPLLLTTRAGLEEIDRSLEALSDDELDAVIERARLRAGSLGDEAVAAIIDEAVRAARAHGRSRNPDPRRTHLVADALPTPGTAMKARQSDPPSRPAPTEVLPSPA